MMQYEVYQTWTSQRYWTTPAHIYLIVFRLGVRVLKNYCINLLPTSSFIWTDLPRPRFPSRAYRISDRLTNKTYIFTTYICWETPSQEDNWRLVTLGAWKLIQSRLTHTVGYI